LVEILFGTFRQHLNRPIPQFLISFVVWAAALAHRAARQVCWGGEVVEVRSRFGASIEAAQKAFIFAEADRQRLFHTFRMHLLGVARVLFAWVWAPATKPLCAEDNGSFETPTRDGFAFHAGPSQNS
jgi:hypothetical protein